MNAIVFDMDGVLTDSEPLICESAIRMFKEKGCTVQPDDFLPFVGTGENRYIGGVAEKYGMALDIAAAKKRTYEIYLSLVASRLRAFPGAVELVRACRAAGFRLAVASSADLIKVAANLNQIGLPPEWWDAIITAEDAERRKPAPDLFLAAAIKMNAEPSECTVVEDAPSGICGAKAAGMRCIAVAQSFPPDQLGGADMVVASIADLSPAALKG